MAIQASRKVASDLNGVHRAVKATSMPYVTVRVCQTLHTDDTGLLIVLSRTGALSIVVPVPIEVSRKLASDLNGVHRAVKATSMPHITVCAGQTLHTDDTGLLIVLSRTAVLSIVVPVPIEVSR